jgi:uncharacterized protein YlxW (UPF0749 family)
MKRIALFGLVLALSAFAADAPRPSASMSAAQNIRGQVGVMIAEVEDAQGWEQASLDNLTALEAEVGAVQKTVQALADKIRRSQADQIGRVTSLATKAQLLREELAAIDRIIAKLEVAP